MLYHFNKIIYYLKYANKKIMEIFDKVITAAVLCIITFCVVKIMFELIHDKNEND